MPGAAKALFSVSGIRRITSHRFAEAAAVDEIEGTDRRYDRPEMRGELGLQHDLLEVLAAWPGDTPGIRPSGTNLRQGEFNQRRERGLRRASPRGQWSHYLDRVIFFYLRARARGKSQQIRQFCAGGDFVNYTNPLILLDA